MIYIQKTDGFSKFYPLETLKHTAFKDTSADECLCKIHENLMFKLKSLQIKYDSTTFSETSLCDTSPNSKCWHNECEGHANGMKIETDLDPEQIVP